MRRSLVLTVLFMLACVPAFAAFGTIIDSTIYPAADNIKCTTGGGTTCAVSNGVLSLTSTEVTIAAVTSGTIDGATVGVSTPAAGNFTTIGATTPGTGALTTLTTSGNVGIGTTRTSKGALEVDGNIYIPTANITAGSALCFTAAQLLGHCTSTPTSGACTCVVN